MIALGWPVALDSCKTVEGVVTVEGAVAADGVVTVVALDSVAEDLKALADLQGRTVNKPGEGTGHTDGLVQRRMGSHLQ